MRSCAISRNRSLRIEIILLLLSRPSPRGAYCSNGGIGRHAGLKILWPAMAVPVRSRLRVHLYAYNQALKTLRGTSGRGHFRKSRVQIPICYKTALQIMQGRFYYTHTAYGPSPQKTTASHLKIYPRRRLYLTKRIVFRIFGFRIKEYRHKAQAAIPCRDRNIRFNI